MPTRARSLFGAFGFSTRPSTFPSRSTSATPKRSGCGTGVRRMPASIEPPSNSVTMCRIPPFRMLSPRYAQKASPPTNSFAHRIAWAIPFGAP